MGATGHLQLIEEVLRWHIEAGVDLAVDETAQDHFAEAAAAASAVKALKKQDFGPEQDTSAVLPTRSSLARPSLAASAVASPDEAMLGAREIAASATTLLELRALMEKFDGCALKATATRLVFGDGDPQAKLMLVGEGPGREEDMQGLPFIGPAGQLLDKMLGSIQIARREVYISNIVPWRPPGNRTPSLTETSICRPFIQRQIELVNPDILICLGGPASQVLLEQKVGIKTIRGRWLEYRLGERAIKAMPTFHPAFLLRDPLQKRYAWRDLQAIRAALDQLPS